MLQIEGHELPKLEIKTDTKYSNISIVHSRSLSELQQGLIANTKSEEEYGNKLISFSYHFDKERDEYFQYMGIAIYEKNVSDFTMTENESIDIEFISCSKHYNTDNLREESRICFKADGDAYFVTIDKDKEIISKNFPDKIYNAVKEFITFHP